MLVIAWQIYNDRGCHKTVNRYVIYSLNAPPVECNYVAEQRRCMRPTASKQCKTSKDLLFQGHLRPGPLRTQAGVPISQYCVTVMRQRALTHLCNRPLSQLMSHFTPAAGSQNVVFFNRGCLSMSWASMRSDIWEVKVHYRDHHETLRHNIASQHRDVPTNVPAVSCW